MSEELLFAAVADDDTGASDLAGMFADQGVGMLLVLDPRFLSSGHPALAAAQGIVLATATRALPSGEAYARTAEAVQLAHALHPRTIQIKYCSTFDSTEAGNIGPSIDAAMDTLGIDFTIAVPALPVNGRTTYCGYHFVKGQLLSDSPMRHHPLTPMTNPNLVDHLGKQTRRAIGLTPYPVVESGANAILAQWDELRSRGTRVAVVDCLNDRHALSISHAAAGLPMISGGSAFGTHLPAVWRDRGWLASAAESTLERVRLIPGAGHLVVAGSCSVATAAQNAWLASQGAEVIEFDPRELLDGTAHAAAYCAGTLHRGGTVLLKTRSGKDEIAASQAWGAGRGWSPAALGLQIARALAELVRQVIELQAPAVLVSAGGETSSALCRALGFSAFAVERNIQPGVPLCLPLDGPCIPVALKSGNFGTEDFYGAAFAAAARVRRPCAD